MHVVSNKRESISLDLGILERYANLLDSSISIPGSKKTIGIDPIIGLIPLVGDMAGYIFSLLLVYKSLRMGASKMLILKMTGNALLDATVGAIPVVGFFFDLAYKSNERNLRLFREYHEQGMHSESTLPLFIALVSISLLFLFGISWICYEIFT